MNKTAVFTIVSKNYLHFARTLMDSVREFHPDWEQHVLLVDKVNDGEFNEEMFQVSTVLDLKLPNPQQFLFRYNILELNTAVKPWMFEWLFSREKYDKVIYLDPDICLYDSMNEVIFELDNGNLMVLTPHLTGFLDDDKKPGEIEILVSGTYNLGFLALAKHDDTFNFLNWWQRKLEFECVVDIPRGLFVDQKWMDLTPGIFNDVKILRHGGYNVAYWNLKHRLVEKINDKFFVNGERLVFFHFSGLNPLDINVLSKHQNRYRISDLDMAVQELVKGYAEKVLANGYNECKNLKYSFNNFEDGIAINDFVRIAYRKDPDLQVKCGANPFAQSRVFLSSHARIKKPGLPILTKIMLKVWESRNDLQEVFPDVWGQHRVAFCQWYIDSVQREYGFSQEYVDPVIKSMKKWAETQGLEDEKLINHEKPYVGNFKPSFYRSLYSLGIKAKPILINLVPSSQIAIIKKFRNKIFSLAYPPQGQIHSISPVVSSSKLDLGINLTGYARAETGVGESCRVAAKSINTTGIPFGIVNFTVGNPARMNDLSWAEKEVGCPKYNVNVFHINADQMFVAYNYLGPDFFNGRYNIGYWAWELPEFPDEWSESFKIVQEVWVPSTFVLDAVTQKSSVPVVRIPHAIEVDCPLNLNRKHFKLPDGRFLFLAMYDTQSFHQRKNPQGAINAFKKAFDQSDSSVGLVLKVNNSRCSPEEIQRLKASISENRNIYLIEETLDRHEVNALINSADCFVSLHRSEGFGLILAEAMALGKPVIGTNWSGNTDFMNNMNSCAVDYKIVNVGSDYGPYKSDQVWAEPDVEHAAFYMQKLVRDQHWSKDIGDKAQHTIRNEFSPEVVGNKINQRLKILGLI